MHLTSCINVRTWIFIIIPIFFIVCIAIIVEDEFKKKDDLSGKYQVETPFEKAETSANKNKKKKN